MSETAATFTSIQEVARHSADRPPLANADVAQHYAARLCRHFALDRILATGQLPDTADPTSPISVTQLVDAVLALEVRGSSTAILPHAERTRRTAEIADEVGISQALLNAVWSWWSRSGRKVGA